MTEETKKVVTSKILESWYAIDSVLFNNHARNVIKEGKVFEEYTCLKASLLSNLYEYWVRSEYTPVETSIPSTVTELQESAVVYAKKGKMLASTIMTKESVKAKIKNTIVSEAKRRNVKDLSAFSDKIIQEKFLQISLDNILTGLPLLECRKPMVDQDFDVQILESGHKMMRNSLIRLALSAKK